MYVCAVMVNLLSRLQERIACQGDQLGHIIVKKCEPNMKWHLTLWLLMSYIYMELLVKPEMLTSYIYGPTFGNAETVSFYLLHNVSTLNQCREFSCVTFVFKHFAS